MKKNIFLFLLLLIYPLTGQSANFRTLDKQDVTYEEITAQPKVILLLWTTWCPGCRNEISRLSKECKISTEGEDIKIFYVSEGERELAVQKFVQWANINSCIKDKILIDLEFYLAKKFMAPGVPTYIFIANGQQIYQSRFINADLINKIFPGK